MAKCPECGGEMVSKMKRKICETCGLSLTSSEYDHMWDKIRDERFTNERKQNRNHADYLKWYESKKA
ncbi:MAG: hypothetical protein ACTSVU_09040 [Promethearchaeota archaeon]